MRRDAATVAMHAVALVVWAFAVGWTVYKMLSDKFPVTRPATTTPRSVP